MKSPSEAIGVDPEFFDLRKCSNARACLETTTGAERQVCGWRIFDEVVIVVDVSSQASENPGAAMRFKGLACRSCGALQPDGIPPEVIAKMNLIGD